MVHLPSFFSAFLTVAVVHGLAVVSPGPDFVMTTRNSIVFSRRTGVFTAVGLALGILVHATYCLVGIGVVISRSILLFNVFKYLGAGYLIFIGWKALTSKHAAAGAQGASPSLQEPSATEAIRMGFLCNVLNPKATLFMLALFTQVISPSTPLPVQAFYGLYMSVATFVWFSFVASVVTFRRIRDVFAAVQDRVERVMGAVLIALGIRVALAARR